MIKIISAALVSLFLMGSAAHAVPSSEIKQVTEQMLSPSVQLNRNCSGTIVYSGESDIPGENVTYILTAKHCVPDATVTQEVFIPTYQSNKIVKEELYTGKVEKLYWYHDLAVVVLFDTETVFENIADVAETGVELFEGEDIWTVGYSRGMTRTISDGLFGNRQNITVETLKPNVEFFRATSPIAGGNSGGALFHKDAETGGYTLIGVTSAGMVGHDFINFYVPIEEINTFLKTILPKERVVLKEQSPATH